jgi:hypothetical protein
LQIETGPENRNLCKNLKLNIKTQNKGNFSLKFHIFDFKLTLTTNTQSPLSQAYVENLCIFGNKKVIFSLDESTIWLSGPGFDTRKPTGKPSFRTFMGSSNLKLPNF